MVKIKVETIRGTIYELDSDLTKELATTQFSAKDGTGFYIIASRQGKNIVIPMRNIEKFEIGD